MVVNENKTQAVVLWVRILDQPNHGMQMLKLKGLDPNKCYNLRGTELVFGGDELMYFGLRMPENNHGDFQFKLYVFDVDHLLPKK